MRVLIVHNSYREAGGEDQAVAQECRLLSSHGHDVFLVSASNREIEGPAKTIRTGLSACYSLQSKQRVMDILGTFRPAIVHAHNLFPLLTPAIYDACIERGLPIVQSLHNYRLICANALFFRKGEICQDCLAHPSYNAILHRCYRNSMLETAIAFGMTAVHRHLQTWNNKVNRFIALSTFSKEKFVQFGLPPQRISIKPNFVPTLPNYRIANGQRNGALFVGRLSEEKGVSTLLKSWQGLTETLSIIGDGPLAALVKRRSKSQNIRWLGYLEREKLFAELQSARFVVIPSQCFENFPLIVAESFAAGTPVVAARIGALSETVINGQTGLLCDAFDQNDLRKKIKWAFDHPNDMELMGRLARKQFDRYYTPSANYRQLMRIYRAALSESPSR